MRIWFVFTLPNQNPFSATWIVKSDSLEVAIKKINTRYQNTLTLDGFEIEFDSSDICPWDSDLK